MPKGQFAEPFNMTRSLREFKGRIPNIKEAVECPVYHKMFDEFATIDLEDIESVGEIDYYCPYCEALVLREFHSPDRQAFEILDRDHKIQLD